MGEAGNSSWGERHSLPSSQPFLQSLDLGLASWDSAQAQLSVRQMGR